MPTGARKPPRSVVRGSGALNAPMRAATAVGSGVGGPQLLLVDDLGRAGPEAVAELPSQFVSVTEPIC